MPMLFDKMQLTGTLSSGDSGKQDVAEAIPAELVECWDFRQGIRKHRNTAPFAGAQCLG